MSAIIAVLVALMPTGLLARPTKDVLHLPLGGYQDAKVAHGIQALLEKSRREINAQAAVPEKGLKAVLLQMDSLSQSSGESATVMIVVVVLALAVLIGFIVMTFVPNPFDNGSAGKDDDPFLTSSSRGSPPNSSSRLSPMSPIPERSGPAATGGPLCSQLVVVNPSGKTYTITGEIKPEQQEETFDVSDEQNGELALLLYIYEDGRDSGILLENSKREPMAFVDTTTAQLQKTSPKPPYVTISRASPVVGGRTAHAPFAVVSCENGSKTVFNASTGHIKGTRVLTIRFNGAETVVVDATETEVAELEVLSSEKINVMIKHGFDAGLVLCTLIAALKLGAKP